MQIKFIAIVKNAIQPISDLRGETAIRKRSGPLGRAFAILRTTVAAGGPLSAHEIADRCSFEPSTAYRVIRALQADGYLIRNERTKKYLPSPQMLFPLPPYNPWNLIRRDAVVTLMALRQRVQLTSGLVIFTFGERILLELASGADPLAAEYDTWLASPLHASGSGKILLMSLSDHERLERLGEGPYSRHTPHTITDPEELLKDLSKSEQRGFVLSCDDYIPGFRVIAAPIVVGARIIGCIFSSGRSSSLPDATISEAARAVKEAAELFSRATPNLRLLPELLGK